ncbi:energy transducer TonB [Pseudaquabacterium rugosum]|jgi:protein TonB|uniref:Energy transducer TonB n=1 Tax=Pseudaquabacterium rugosum TaxID=2984194 RepID=A0ABU9B8H6_9BURK
MNSAVLPSQPAPRAAAAARQVPSGPSLVQPPVGAPAAVAQASGEVAGWQPSRGPRPAIVGIVALHALLGWALLQGKVLPQAVAQVPLFVSMIDLPAPPPEPPPPAPPPTPQKKVVTRADVTPPPMPLPPPEVQVSVPAPPAPPPAPPAPVIDTPVPVAAPVVAAAVAAPPAPPAPPPRPAPVAPREVPSSALAYVELPEVVYPRLSRRNGESGRVVLRVLVGPDGGMAREVTVAQSSGHARLDDAAIQALKRARFKALMVQGVGQTVWALVPIDFDLES